MSATRGSAGRGAHGATLLLVLVTSAFYVGARLDRGWVPYDEGMIGVNAERVLRGELPHRDFDENYTGGLTAVHAAAFRILGVRLMSPRLVLFGFFLVFTAAAYAIAARLLPPVGAGLATLLVVAWSFPNYLASMPSWYVLVFTVLGVLALLRERESHGRGWLFLAGLCAGAALLVLIVGLYFVAAVFLYLAFRETENAARRALSADGTTFFALQVISVAAFLALLLAVVGRSLSAMGFLQFVVPSAILAAVLLTRAWRVRGNGAVGERLRALFGLAAPFLAGAALPAAGLAAYYASQGALHDLARGVFVLPMRQLAAATAPFPPLSSAGAAVPYAVLFWTSVRRDVPIGRSGLALLAVALAGILVLSGSEEAYRGIFHSARSAPVVAAVIGAIALAGRREVASVPDAEVFLLLSTAGLLSLLQFPFAAPIYFCYAAPLAILALAALIPPPARATHAIVAVFYVVFAIWRLHPGYIWTLGVTPRIYGPLARLDDPRASLRVPESDRRTYRALVAEVRRRSPDGGFIYAAPDCPEVYYLSARRNPTGDLFEYLRPPPSAEALLERLRETMVAVVVINERPDYSPLLDGSTRASLAAAFPHETRIDKFRVRWKEAP